MSTWETLKSEEKEIRYYIKNDDYVDEIEIKESSKTISIKYEIRPSEECDLLKVKTREINMEVCYSNQKNHEDPFFTYKDYFTDKTNDDIEQMINEIKSYILDVIAYSLNVDPS